MCSTASNSAFWSRGFEAPFSPGSCGPLVTAWKMGCSRMEGTWSIPSRDQLPIQMMVQRV